MNALDQYKIWHNANMLWFHSPIIGLNDTKPARKHYALALLQDLVDKCFMTDATKSGKMLSISEISGDNHGLWKR